MQDVDNEETVCRGLRYMGTLYTFCSLFCKLKTALIGKFIIKNLKKYNIIESLFSRGMSS